MKCASLQPEPPQSMLSEDYDQILKQGKSRGPSSEESLYERMAECISVLKQHGDKRGIFYKRPLVSYEKLTSEEILAESVSLCEAVEAVADRLSRLDIKIKEAEFRENSLIPWEDFELPFETTCTESSRIAFYILREPRSLEDVIDAAARKDMPLHAEEVMEEKDRHYIAVLFHRNCERTVKEIMASFGAGEFLPEDMTGTAAYNIAACREETKNAEKEISHCHRELENLAQERNTLETAYDGLKIKLQCMEEQQETLNTQQVSVMTGWIPVSEKERFEKSLERYDCYCEYESPESSDEPPVLMRNNRLVEPFGAITEMYSLPDPRSIDTNWAIGLFFFVFFGMMLSDAGYGLVLMAAGFCGAAFLDVGEGAKRLMKMIGICGVSTVFWGALYGSWFGDMIPVVSQTFFGRSVYIPQLIDPLSQPMTVLVLSCVLGVIHLFTGMGIKAYIMIRRGDKWGALFDVGFWYMLLGGLLLLLAPEPFDTAGLVSAAAGAAGLVLTQGRHKPKLAGKIISGVMSLYGITGYFSDVLSYSRILALGLATGVVASVVNIMASMAGGGVIGMLLFAVIFVAGHMLNLGINALGAYVHAARLQYVEFFGKYYEGGGRKFKPLKIDTKYVRVMGERE